ncbi:MAG: hypothetical protein OES32_17875 [Acidobacteriota bacterium]|nr:hypothetical protein [Acidobacteriota bacterium]
MGVLRCTAKYRKLFGLPDRLEEPAPPVSGLGAWYANTLNVGHGRYLHYMSEKARLSVIVELRHRHTAELRFPQTLAELLRHFGTDARCAEMEAMSLTPLVYGRATDRSVLGSMRDHSQLAKACLRDGEGLWDAMLFLAEAPSGPLDYESPDRVAPRLVENTW